MHSIIEKISIINIHKMHPVISLIVATLYLPFEVDKIKLPMSRSYS